MCAGAPLNPAKIWGLYPRKGVIQPGADADIAVVDLDREWTIDDAKLQSLSRITPFHGRRVKGLPIHTLVRGRFVMKDRVLKPDTRGWGRSVHAIQQMPPPRAEKHRQHHAGHRPRRSAGQTGARRMSVAAVAQRRCRAAPASAPRRRPSSSWRRSRTPMAAASVRCMR